MIFEIFMGLPSVSIKGVFRTQPNIYYGTILQKSSILDVRLGSEYASVYTHLTFSYEKLNPIKVSVPLLTSHLSTVCLKFNNLEAKMFSRYVRKNAMYHRIL